MTNQMDYTIYSWYCPNCGTLVTGLKNREGDVKAQCGKCRVIMKRRDGSQNRITIEVIPEKSRNAK